MQSMADERREGKRSRMLKGGVIAFSARHATIPCVVRDLSEGGARLQVAQSSAVPDTFELIVELDGLEVPCQVVWRKVSEVGVAFTGTPSHVAPKRMQVVTQAGPIGRSTVRRSQAGSGAPAPTQPAAPRMPAAHPEGAVRSGSPVPAPAAQARSGAAAEAVAAPPAVIVAVKVPASPAPAASRHSGGRNAIPILIAEDDPDDRLLMRDAFAESRFSHRIDFVENGEELLKYVRREAPYQECPYPGLILLDLNMPRMDGRTALMHLKTDSHFKRIPVIVLTTSNADDDIQRTYDLGVTAYVSKPSTQEGLLQLINSLNGFWSQFVSLPAA
ncbi:MAG: response regulator [Hyphomicrobiaceae bacterium]|nr:response regulator [Hyphomicrobiaceae bacterium]